MALAQARCSSGRGLWGKSAGFLWVHTLALRVRIASNGGVRIRLQTGLWLAAWINCRALWLARREMSRALWLAGWEMCWALRLARWEMCWALRLARWEMSRALWLADGFTVSIVTLRGCAGLAASFRVSHPMANRTNRTPARRNWFYMLWGGTL